MRTVSSATCVVAFGLLLSACEEAPSEGEDTAGVDLPAAEAPSAAAIDLSPFAGTWNLVARNEAGDSITEAVIVAHAQPDGWTSTFPGREPIPLRITNAAGDSVVLESGPYESVLDPGVQVTTRNVIRVQGDEMVGTFFSHRTVSGPDSIMRGVIRGARER